MAYQYNYSNWEHGEKSDKLVKQRVRLNHGLETNNGRQYNIAVTFAKIF